MSLRDLLHELVHEIGELKARIKVIEKHLEALARQTPVVERLRTIPGVGLPTATALVGFVGRCRALCFWSPIRLLSGSDAEGTFQRGAASVGTANSLRIFQLLIDQFTIVKRITLDSKPNEPWIS